MKTQFFSAGVGLAFAALSSFSPALRAETVTVYVGMAGGGVEDMVKTNGYGYMPGLFFSPAMVSIKAGDTVQWVWNAGPHSTTSGTPGKPSGLWDSGVKSVGSTYTHQFTTVGTFSYYCSVHGLCCGMTGSVTVTAATPTPTPTPTPNPTVPARPLNISTRIQVETGDQVLIGGFIVTGTSPKRLILRAIGPSLADAGIANPLADPVLELHASDQSVITSNDNWKDSDEANISATGLAPANLLESAIVETLDPGSYTAVVSGKNGGTGIGLVEVYDLDQSDDSQLANISTRASVQTGNNVMIGGFILGGGGANSTVLIRALGPSLTQFGISDALSDPSLELHDINGTLIGSNNDWKDTQQTEIEATGLQPPNDFESALLETLGPAAYTAIVMGQGGVTGVGLVEVYRLQ
ncbi:MAG TPA: plastocyanin/azurin family copper-binding protein [Chthoniobacterales bacterium]|jgi:plastocyanin